MTDIVRLKALNAARWNAMHIDPALGPSLDVTAKRLCAAKSRYAAVSARTTVPWFVIAVIHQREASQSWAANLAQGDPWDEVSVHVPKGQGPFASWEAAAVNALEHCAPFAAHWVDWSIGGALTLLEEYNGLGYAARGVPSPYIWASTNQYRSGKYIADGHYDPNAVDHQLGCAALLSRMMAMDKSIVFANAASQIAAAAPAAFHAPSSAELAAGFKAGRAAVDNIAGSWASWISDDAVKQVVADIENAAAKARAGVPV